MLYKKITLYLLLLLTTNQTSPIPLTEWIVWAAKNPNKSISVVAITYYIYKRIQYFFFMAVACYFKEIRSLWLGTSLIEYAQKEYNKGNKAFLLYLAHHQNNQAFLCCAYDLYIDDKNKHPLFFLLDKGVNAHIKYGYHSLLKYACINNNAELVEKLLKNNADPNAPTPFINFGFILAGGHDGRGYKREINDDGSPLVIAFHKNFPEIIQLLIQYSAEPIMLNEQYPKLSYLCQPLYPLNNNDYISFNHFIDYCSQTITPNSKKLLENNIYQYWLAQQIFLSNKIPDDISKNHIFPLFPLLIIYPNFNQSLEPLFQKYTFTDAEKEEVYTKKEEILKVRRDHPKSFLPMITT